MSTGGKKFEDPFKPLPEQVMYGPFFALVSNKENWKYAIDATIEAPSGAADRALYERMITRAVEFYAGCTPTITAAAGRTIRVRAAGYYSAVGA